jgi:hypothetical protein
MADLFLLSEAQMRRIEHYFPLSHGIARVDDWTVSGGSGANPNRLRARIHCGSRRSRCPEDRGNRIVIGEDRLWLSLSLSTRPQRHPGARGESR